MSDNETVEYVGRMALARIASIIKNYVDNRTYSKSALDITFNDIQSTLSQLQEGSGSQSSGNYVALPENDDDEFTVGSVVFCQIKASKFPTYVSAYKRRISHGDQIHGSDLMTAQFVVDTEDAIVTTTGQTLSGEWIYLGADFEYWPNSTKYFYGMFRRKS